MDMPELFQLRERYAYYRPEGQVSLETVVTLVSGAITCCVKKRIPNLLVNISALTGFAPPSMGERLSFVMQWAGMAGRQVMVALVAGPAWIQPQKFQRVMTPDRGLLNDAFTSEAEAIAWLTVESRDAGRHDLVTRG